MVEDSVDLDTLVRRRGAVKGQLTKTKNEVDTQGRTFDTYALDARLTYVEELGERFSKIQDHVEGLDPSDENDKEREDFDRRIMELRTSLLRLKGSLARQASTPPSASGSSSAAASQPTPVTLQLSNLPKIDVPEFDGDYTKWYSFWNSFRALVDSDPHVDKVIKFAHLARSLKGHARDLVSSLLLDPTAANYDEAKKVLAERYENKRLIFQEHIAAIFDQACMARNTPNELLRLVNTIGGHLDALKMIGSSQQILDCLLLHLVLGKLSEEVQLRWERRAKPKDIPEWKNFAEFLVSECQTMEHHEAVRRHFETFSGIYGSQTSRKSESKPSYGKNNRERPSTCSNVAESSSRQRKCPVCAAEGHQIYTCPDFLSLSVSSRYDKVRSLRLCMNCLLSGHERRKCKAGNCRQCNQRHHTLLHNPNLPSANSGTSQQLAQQPNRSQTPAVDTSGKTSTYTATYSNEIELHPNNYTFLATALIEVETKSGQFIPARAMLDNGSQSSFFTTRFASLLGIKGTEVHVEVTGFGEESSSKAAKSRITTRIRSRTRDFSSQVEALVVPRIVNPQPSASFSSSCVRVPSGLALADPFFYEQGPIDVLLGADIYYLIEKEGKVILGEPGPVLKETELGWVLGGNIPAEGSRVSSFTVVAEEETLSRMVERFWETEEIPSSAKNWTSEEEMCEKRFRESIQRDSEGRFSLLLPFKGPPSDLGDSFISASRRFRALERRLQKDQSLSRDYRAAIREFLESGFAEFVNPSEYEVLNYLPQQAVVKTDSTSYKVRPVFDASCPTSSGKSLNDILCVGPNLQDDLLSLLLRSRCYSFLISADISKMYLQIVVRPPDANLQCILWREDPEDDFKVIRINRVTFGTGPASFLSVRCLYELADLYRNSHPLAAHTIENNFYMDNMFAGADSIDELRQIRDETSFVLSEGCFPLRKWATNCSEIFREIPEADREKLVQFGDSVGLKALGLMWLPESDHFAFKYSIPSDQEVTTRRQALSLLARLHDLLGLIGPVITLGKLLIQETWTLPLKWDDKLPDDLVRKWSTFRQQLSFISEFRIPRSVLAGPTRETIILHGFSDASEKAYGAVFYFCSRNESGQVRAHLLCSKSRVAPRKTVTLARLELCAMALLADLLRKIQSAISHLSYKIALWSDSTIALYWIKRPPTDWATYVANRVSKIQSLTAGATWRHVSGEMNPADLVSRGLLPNQLLKSTLWLEGPEFIKKPVELWPASVIPPTEMESRSSISAGLAGTQQHDLVEEWFLSLHRRCFRDLFSSVRRTFAILVRYRRKKSERSLRSNQLEARELLHAEMLIVRLIQRKAFEEEYTLLQKGKSCHPKSKLHQLTPFLDENGLIRVGGRLENSGFPYDTKHPILLPSSHPFVTSLVYHYHEKNLHVGPQGLLAIIRTKYWILRGRDAVRKITQSCRTCQRTNPKLASQIMGNLPPERLSESSPFTHCGVDLFGPLQIHYTRVRGKVAVKCYGALFVCMTTKMVHLELVRDLTTESFLHALWRFIARRGTPETMSSDNGTNLVGANRWLRDARHLFNDEFREKLVRECAERGFVWKFIPPGSPHFGGLWEAGVKQAKRLIQRVCTSSSFTEDELETIFCEAEAVLNSRPLAPVSADPNDFQAVTPGHFAVGKCLKALPEPSFRQPVEKLSRLRRLQRVIWAKQNFWQNWSLIYFSELQKRAKWRSPKANLKIGDLVLLQEANTPSRRWPLARIVKVHPGKDGNVRVVTIRTPTGEFTRSVTKICPLLDENQENLNLESNDPTEH